MTDISPTKVSSCGGCTFCNGTGWNCSDVAVNLDSFNECLFTANTGSCIADTCNGNGACSFNLGGLCHASAGICDLNETCNGTSYSCPTDAFNSSSTICRGNISQCDAVEYCTGSLASCPADVNKSDGTTCNDSLFCIINDRCISGQCIGDSQLIDDSENCTADSCNEILDIVENIPIDIDDDGFSICSGIGDDCDDSNPLINPEAPEICTNGIDDNCNNESDYDTNNIGNLHGDIACPVNISNLTSQYNSFVENGNATIWCTPSSNHEVNSLLATLNGEQCLFDYYLPDYKAQFICPTGIFNVIQGKTALCYVNTSKSYSNENKSKIFPIKSSLCSIYNLAECTADSNCGWCEECNALNQWNLNPSALCAEAGSCSYVCSKGKCNAECDNTANPCPKTECNDYCIGNTLYLRDNVTNDCITNCTCTGYSCSAGIETPCGVNSACTFPNTIGSCSIPCISTSPDATCGSCTPVFLQDCNCTPEYVDLNNNSADGCEYHCNFTSITESCGNSLDDNCNGIVDDGCCGDVVFDPGEECEAATYFAFPNINSPNCTATECNDFCGGVDMSGDGIGDTLFLSDNISNNCTSSCTCTNALCMPDAGTSCGANSNCTFPNTVGDCSNPCLNSTADATCGNCTPIFLQDCICEPGWIDIDGNETNGCEYNCTPTNLGIEACGDNIDNNCDNHIDEQCCGNTIIDFVNETCEALSNYTWPVIGSSQCLNPGNTTVITNITVNNITYANITGICDYSSNSFNYTDLYGDCNNCGCTNDVSDISESNSTTPANTSLYCELCDHNLDNITNCDECRIIDAYWEKNDTLQGQDVFAIVHTENCDGYQFNYSVFQQNLLFIDDPALVNPLSSIVGLNQAHSIWTAEWMNDCGGFCNPPEYYFIATAANDSSIIITSGLMDVYRANNTVIITSDRKGYYCYPECVAYINVTNEHPDYDGIFDITILNIDGINGSIGYNISELNLSNISGNMTPNYSQIIPVNGSLIMYNHSFYNGEQFNYMQVINIKDIENGSSAKWNFTYIVGTTPFVLDPYIDSIEVISPPPSAILVNSTVNFTYIVHSQLNLTHNCTIYVGNQSISNNLALVDVPVEANYTFGPSSYSWHIECTNPFSENGTTAPITFGIPPYCGDKMCTETCQTCSQDCGSCQSSSSGGGGGGGGGSTICDWNYTCSPWSECKPDGTQTRVCKDNDACENLYKDKIRISNEALIKQTRKPAESIKCSYMAPDSAKPTQEMGPTIDISSSGSEGRILSISDFDISITNNKDEDYSSVEVTFDIPDGWDQKVDDYQKDLSSGSSIDVKSSLLIPYTDKEQNTIKVKVVSGGDIIATKDIPFNAITPEFLVATDPSFDNVMQDHLKMYYIISNKGSSAMKGAEIEMNINKGRSTKMADFMGSYSVESGKTFMVSKGYDISSLPAGSYEITGKLAVLGLSKKTSTESLEIA